MARQPNACGEYHCRKCDAWKPESDFHKYGRKSHGGRYAGQPVHTCKTCRSTYMKRYATTDEHKEANRRSVDKNYVKRAALIRGLKDKPCTVCRGSFHFAAMDFHHREPLAGRKRLDLYHCSRQRLFDEIAKCDLVCSNCHRVISWAAKGGDAVVEEPIDRAA